MQIIGKTALVTGANRGLGRAYDQETAARAAAEAGIHETDLRVSGRLEG